MTLLEEAEQLEAIAQAGMDFGAALAHLHYRRGLTDALAAVEKCSSVEEAVGALWFMVARQPA